MKFSYFNVATKAIKHTRKNGVLSTAALLHALVHRSAVMLLLPGKLTKRIAETAAEMRSGFDIVELRSRSLDYVESMRLQGSPYGRYRYAGGQRDSVLYASVFAALTRHVYGDLASLTTQQRNEWVAYIKAFQSDDGLFRDPEVDCELAASVDWWGWQHLSFHTVTALSCLGGVADKRFKILEPFKDEAFIDRWFLDLHLTGEPSTLTNAHSPLYIVTLLQYARDYQGEQWADSAIRSIIRLLDLYQDPETGCWCTANGRKELINEGVKISYHLWVFYFFDGYPVRCTEAAINSLISTQNSLGGFDKSVNSSACDDIDSIEPLCRMTKITQYRRSDITDVLQKAVPWILANMNEDGGFVFKRGEAFKYGHQKMYSGADESNMFATWFRTLSLAYIGKCLPDSWPGRFDWHFERIPGLQFWYT